MTRKDDVGLLWLRGQWESLVASGETTLGWTAWCREAGVEAADNHGWQDTRRVKVIPFSALNVGQSQQLNHGEMREPVMHPIIPMDDLPKRRRRRRPPKAKAA